MAIPRKEGNEYPYSPIMVIEDDLRAASPHLALGVIQAEVAVVKKTEEVWSMLQASAKRSAGRTTLDTLPSLPNVQAAREVYKKLGKEPSRYRVSSEALIRRILQGKGMYQINTVVDINNIISVESFLSVGSYDLDKITAPVRFRVGKNRESYKGIGKEMINIEGLPVFTDDLGPFGSPTSDSERAMITQQTKRLLMVIISFGGSLNGQLDQYVSRGSHLVETYAQGKNLATSIVT